MTMQTARHAAREPTFLPFAVAAARAAVAEPAQSPLLARAQVLRRHAEAADAAAADCWTVLLAGCQTSARRVLPSRLRELTEATSLYLGSHCWYGTGSPHRGRVTAAEARIIDAVHDGDGAEFAEAFAGYDQAVATAVASAHGRAGSHA
jgi:hypothetical protein